MPERLLIVEDEETLRESLCRVFEREGYEVAAVGGAEAALNLFTGDSFDLVITDIILPGITGIELIKRIKELDTNQPSIVMTAYASLETAVETLRAGAYDYIVKPIIHEELKQTVRNALNMRALEEENLLLKRQMGGPFDMTRVIGEHPDMARVKEWASQAAGARDPVLIAGELGTGKRLIARAIHDSGTRPSSPFLEKNCAELHPDSQVEALFGRTRGVFQSAKGGTVYLKRVETLSLDVQDMLFEVLMERSVSFPDGGKPLRMDALVLVGTVGDPETLSSGGKLHQSLYGILKETALHMPPLRTRGGDIDRLADFFLGEFGRKFGKSVGALSPEVLQRFHAYHWPGNVLELRNLMERAVLFTRSERLEMSDFQSIFQPC
jgi:DNA-binding NtrC family response regulator